MGAISTFIEKRRMEGKKPSPSVPGMSLLTMPLINMASFLERLPSGKFETNEPVMELAILSYSILRMIGQESIERRGTATRHKVRRRRLHTVIGNMIMMAGHVTEHARQLLIGLGRSNPWRYAFAEVYTAFADFRA